MTACPLCGATHTSTDTVAMHVTPTIGSLFAGVVSHA